VTRGLIVVLALAACARERPLPADVRIRFLVDGREVRSLSLAEIADRATPVSVTTDDPYYGKAKRFRAVKLETVLDLGFGVPHDEREVLLRAKDGYTVPVSEELVREPGAYLAFADEDVKPYEPIGPQRVSPFPLYLVWTSPGQGDLATHPRPWQLESIERVHFAAAYPHTAPPPDAPETARRG
jgi:hypothetical protein